LFDLSPKDVMNVMTMDFDSNKAPAAAFLVGGNSEVIVQALQRCSWHGCAARMA
jgi:desulfoferrodoxin (superoxide reductase-like protein)